MQSRKTLFAGAALSALASLAHGEAADQAAAPAAKPLPTVTVTSTPFGSTEGEQILAPAKVLSGDELRDKLGSSLGDTLSHELGVSSSAFGAGAARPIIRGLEGARVKVLENGMGVSDVSGLSNDHAVASDGPTARQIEILRGPAALLYGSGAIGGLVNVINERIPTTLEPQPSGEASLRYGTVDRARNASFSIDGASGKIGLHADASARLADDFRIPGNSVVGDPSSPSGQLPWSFTRQHSVGVGAAVVDDWGHIGASFADLANLYGIPTAEGSQIDQKQKRYDVDALFKAPSAAFEQVKFKLGYTDYRHAELDHQSAPVTTFTNRAFEARLEAAHAAIAGWHGSVGMQAETTHFSALSVDGSPDTVPQTRSTANAIFLVEEHDFVGGKVNAGIRYEDVQREPVRGLARKFGLTSWSVGGAWPVAGDISAGLTLSVAQRAPAAEELYSAGPHDATQTFDLGDENLRRETSHNVEFTVQQTTGPLRWKANAYLNKVRDFIYGEVTGTLVDDDGSPGGELHRRLFRQANATIHGIEAEVGSNPFKEGLAWRLYGDASQGRLDDAGSLPLQPAARVGLDLTWREGSWRGALSTVRAMRQERLASFETSPTAGYTQMDASIAWTQKLDGGVQLNWFLQAKNLLDQDIRMSTSLLKDVAPLPGRNFIAGVRARF